MHWFPESIQNRDRYLLDWFKLDQARGEVAMAGDESRNYWPSSPCAGAGDFTDTFHADNLGDMHYWKVWQKAIPFDNYCKQRPRFCSEFGFQSFPSIETVREFCPPEDFNITSPTMEFHQRTPREFGDQYLVCPLLPHAQKL